MHLRPLRSPALIGLTSLLFLGLAPAALAAGEKDKEAMKLYDQAMNEDYLNTDFAKASKKLQDAIKKCGDAGCSADVLGKLHVALGTVYGVGLGKMDQAKDEFVAALKADPGAALDEALSNPELTKTFNEAKKTAKSAPSGEQGGSEKPSSKPPPSGGMAVHTPPAEQVVNTPVPIYIEPTEEIPLSKVVLRYKPFGGKQYKSIELKKMDGGFGGEIPCEDVTTTGEVKYFFVLTGEDGESAGTLGSTTEPFRVKIKNEIEGEAPSLPGKKPPSQCQDRADCPPGLPGCPGAGEKRGDKGWGASCEETKECQSGLVCLNGSCEEGTEGGGEGGGGKAESKNKRNLVGVGLQLDMLLISGQENVCSPEAGGSYACFVQGTDTQFYGPVVARNGTNGIQGGFAFADARPLISFDRQWIKGLPLTFGARIGWAFGGSPTPTNAPPKGSNYVAANGFLPFFAEVRGAYHIGGDPFAHQKIRPYVFAGFGIAAQVNASVPVEVCRGTGNSSENNCKTKDPSNKVTVDAYQITGLNAVTVGGGAIYGITPNFGVSAELKLMFMLPTFGFVFAPTVGPVFAF